MNDSPKKLTPKKAVLLQCRNCVGGKLPEIENCTGYDCPFYPYRFGNKRVPVKVMRSFCKECACDSDSYIRDCPSRTCPVYPYRSGTNPARAKLSRKTYRERGFLIPESTFKGGPKVIIGEGGERAFN